MKLNYSVSCEYLDFASGAVVTNGDKSKIYVFSYKEKNKIYKHKYHQVGIITVLRKKECLFTMCENVSLYTKTMHIISRFMIDIKTERLFFNKKRGELYDTRSPR